MWTAHAGDRGGQRTPDPLDLKSKVVVNRYVGEGNKTRVLYQCSLPEPSHQPWKEIIWVVLRISQTIFNSHFLHISCQTIPPLPFLEWFRQRTLQTCQHRASWRWQSVYAQLSCLTPCSSFFPIHTKLKGEDCLIGFIFSYSLSFLYFVLSWC